ncbi:MAG: hypothetical protein M3069_15205 [Chloroflexota bacterium]|nr:hypothetical protein [Chloroflexota bacterium]
MLPLAAPEVWSGFRLAQSDPVLSAISSLEQPLTVRSPGGVWAIAVALAWFSLAYWQQRMTLWEAVLVLVGSGLALARLGNGWADAALILLPFGRQIAIARFKPSILALAFGVCVVAAGLTLADSRPPSMPPGVAETVAATGRHGKILADWRWAGDLQQRLGPGCLVLASDGVGSQSSEFWLDYVRVAKGHEQWAEALARMEVEVVVLDASEQQRQAADLVRASPDWQVLYDTSTAVVATRVSV